MPIPAAQIAAWFQAQRARLGFSETDSQIIRAHRPLLTLRLRKSRWQRRLLFAAFAFASVLIPAAQISLELSIFLAVSLMLYGAWQARRQRNPVVEISIDPMDALSLRREAQNEPETAQPLLPIFVAPWLIAFDARTQSGDRIRCAFFPDQMHADDFRALRIRLRHLRTIE